jgi:uncharacterized LabA/DUF88 family protein
VTTQNTHHEHSDIDESVVEHQPAPENTVAPSTSETVTPHGAEIQASDEPATPIEPQVAILREALTVSEASTIQVGERHVSSEQQGQLQNTSSSEATAGSAATPEYNNSIASEENATASTSDESSLPKTIEDEIRPFTDFIEEFRQAEEARLNASRQEIQSEPLELLSPEVAPLLIEAVSVEHLNENDAAPLAQQPLEETVKEAPTPPKVPERAVSPLLRPARLRVPRHSGRHLREEANVEKVENSVMSSTTAQPVVSETPAPPQSEQDAATEVTREPEQPRPARRYRFDRPTSTTNGANGAIPTPFPAAALQHTEENKEKDVPGNRTQAHAETAQNEDGQQVEGAGTTSNVKNESTATPVVEQATQKQLQETLLPESTNTHSTNERNRRRQGQERQKEQPVVTPTPDVVSSVTESVPQSGDIAPEDLPPLEYSELQKASTRRRRRHRPTTSSNGSTVAAAETQAVQPPVAPTSPAASLPAASLPAASLPAVQRPAAPGVNGNQYTIVSGYTVGQMNQGNETAGPFMGPEPSPARGSIVTRDGRTVRAESQRSPIYPPVRTHEAGVSSASLNHFASTISQAIQTQTDRMVAELRRNSQAPTNVSVSLPPFPSTERVGVFVDVANLLYSARTLRIAVDFGRLLDFLRGNRRLVRAHAYCPTSPQAGDEQMFLQAVKGLGYRITTKNYKTFSSGAKKADLDLDLCMDVVRLVDGRAVDCVVLVSGDSDFMPMLDYCSDHGVRVEVAAFDEAMSATLRQSCDLFINLSMLEEIRS